MDGIDAVLVDLDEHRVSVVAYQETPYPDELRVALRIARDAQPVIALRDFMQLHVSIGRCFAEAANRLLERAGIEKRDVVALGTHGQTVLHSPNSTPPFTLQIGDPATIAVRTGITTVADFRSMDMAAGGQGAPLAPAFHAAMFRSPDQDRAVVNIGGIANVTLLPRAPDQSIRAFDSGPGNCLLDEWYQRHRAGKHDVAGEWAAAGTLSPALLARLHADPYFSKPAPKSTGRDHFNLAWLMRLAPVADYSAEDVQATLVELTATSIAKPLATGGLRIADVLLCGGGAANAFLVGRIRAALPACRVVTTAEHGLPPDRVEAVAFAWLARQRLAGIPFPTGITGTSTPVVAGAVYQPRNREPT
jgi:anhydro-N-acetylmuramic acid kinase